MADAGAVIVSNEKNRSDLDTQISACPMAHDCMDVREIALMLKTDEDAVKRMIKPIRSTLKLKRQQVIY